jgi:sulfonate transport system substrate-binding protein
MDRTDLVARPSFTRQRRWVAAAALLALAAVAGCSSGSSSATGGATSTGTAAAQADVSSVTLHIGDQAGTGAQALLTAAGLIDKLPFKVAWSDFTSGPPMLQAMAAGSVDVGGVGNAPPVFAAAGGDKIAIVGALQANPHGAALLVPKGSPIHSVAQLKGKRIAVAQGSSADYHLLTVLTKAGLRVHDVTLVYLQPAAGLAALTSGHVDAWDIWSPFIEEGQKMNGATAIVTGEGYGSPYSFTVASRAALADPGKAAAIRDYLSLIAQAHQWASSHLSAWAAVWAKASGLPLTVMTQAASDSASLAVPITPTVVASEQQVADAFTKAGLIPVHVDFSQFVDTSFNATAGTSS